MTTIVINDKIYISSVDGISFVSNDSNQVPEDSVITRKILEDTYVKLSKEFVLTNSNDTTCQQAFEGNTTAVSDGYSFGGKEQ